MTRNLGSVRRAYVLAIAATLPVLAVMVAVYVRFERPLLITLMFPLLLCAHLGGLRGGLTVTIVGVLGAVVLIPAVGGPSMTEPAEAARIATFAMFGVVISLLSERLHMRREDATVALAASRRSEEKFSDMFHASPVPKVVTRVADWVVLEVNDAYLETFGVTREALVGHTAREAGIVVDRSQMAELYATVQAHGEVRNAELHCTIPSGEHRTLFLSSRMRASDGEAVAITTFVDVTARRLAEASAQANSDRFRQLAESISQVFWLTDPDKREMIYVSPAYETIWGRSCAELKQCPKAWLEAVHPDDRARVIEAIPRQALGGYDETFRIVRPDGEVRWIYDKGFPVYDAAGALIRVAGVASDITEQRALEDRLRQTQKLESIGLLAGGVAHDFNNILGVIAASAELLAESTGRSAEDRELVDDISAGVTRATSLTRQLLAFSRKQVVEPVVLDLNEAIESTRKMLTRLLGEDIQLRLALTPEIPRVRCDPGQLTQVLMNLAVNARDAMDRRGTLTIATRAAAGRVVVAVTDSGSGITDDVRAKMFEPFFTTKAVGLGTGLGLSVVHGIVEQAAGRIQVESTLGTGTTFEISLPAAAGPSPREEVSPTAPERGAERLLVVDDDPYLRVATARSLRARGYKVFEASDGLEALRVLEDQRVDLVVTDVVMPNMNGRALADAARLRFPGLMFLFTSGYTDDEVLRAGVLQAEVPFLEKPFRLHVLAAKVRQLIDERRDPAAGHRAPPTAVAPRP